MMHRASTWPVVVLALAAGACGSSYGPDPSPTPTPTPARTRTVLVARGFSLAGGAMLSDTVDNVQAGVIDARVDWPGTSDLNLYVTGTSCPGRIELLGAQCRVLAQAVGTAKPERIEFTTTATGNYIYWVHNLGVSSEAVTFEFGLTR